MALAYRVELSPVSVGASEENSISYNAGVADVQSTNPELVTSTVMRANAAQMLGLMRYIALIKYGATTTGIETAIATALV